MSRPRPEVDDVARIEAWQGELRRLRGEVHPPLHERFARMQRELEQTTVKIPKKISTS